MEIIAADFLGLDENALLVGIGSEVSRDMAQALPLSTADLLRVGRNWITANLSALRSSVCGSSVLRGLQAAREPHEIIFHATCELLVGLATGSHLGFVAAFITKQGVHVFCRELWETTV